MTMQKPRPVLILNIAGPMLGDGPGQSSDSLFRISLVLSGTVCTSAKNYSAALLQKPNASVVLVWIPQLQESPQDWCSPPR